MTLPAPSIVAAKSPTVTHICRPLSREQNKGSLASKLHGDLKYMKRKKRRFHMQRNSRLFRSSIVMPVLVSSACSSKTAYLVLAISTPPVAPMAFLISP
jgi:hypothetical protein